MAFVPEKKLTRMPQAGLPVLETSLKVATERELRMFRNHINQLIEAVEEIQQYLAKNTLSP